MAKSMQVQLLQINVLQFIIRVPAFY